ncbi:SAM-dependent RNA methyltransferase, partial [Gorgonomyces haynaldii]
YIVEHLEPDVDGWVEIEYKNMIAHVGKDNLIFSSVSPELAQNMPKSIICTVTTESVGDWPLEKQKKVLLLDPSSEIELQPSDVNDYEYLLFGGILGDVPSRDMTSVLRKMGFTTRHLGPKQMSTDTAVIVAQQVLEKGIPLNELKYIDDPEIKIGKRETVTLPFRYLADENGNPKLPPGLREHLKHQND